jgi:hypothetical protein
MYVLLALSSQLHPCVKQIRKRGKVYTVHAFRFSVSKIYSGAFLACNTGTSSDKAIILEGLEN